MTNASLSSFTTTMNARIFNFTFDHAVAIMDKDIWSNSASASAATRSGVIGYSIVGGVCSTNKYSIVEDMGFNNIGNAAHELGHNLGAQHDGSSTSVNCSASLNYLMTPNIGAYATNLQNLYMFSNCSINNFKTKFLSANKSVILTGGKCLTNLPVSTLSSYFNTSTYLPGQLYGIEDQCQMLYGPSSSYSACYIANDPICEALYCYDSGSCFGTDGYGALDGTGCGTGKICYKNACVNSTGLIINTISSTPCSPNPCLNGATCSVVNKIYVCNCASPYTGQKCDLIL